MNLTTRAPLEDRLALIPRQPLRCIGSVRTATGWRDYPISWSDADRDRTWAQTYLETAGVGRGDFVCVVSSGHEAPWYQAMLDAVTAIGATICPLEPARFELGRALMFFRRYPISCIVGLDHELASTLASEADPRQLFAKVRLCLTRPDAWHFAREAGLDPRLILPVGPALGLGIDATPTITVDAGEWRLEEISEGLAISALRERALGAEPILLPDDLPIRPLDLPGGKLSACID